MAEALVDRLEAVQVDQGQGERLGASFGARDLLPQAGLEGGVVEAAGERVQRGRTPGGGVLVRVAAGAAGQLRERAQQLHVARRPRVRGHVQHLQHAVRGAAAVQRDRDRAADRIAPGRLGGLVGLLAVGRGGLGRVVGQGAGRQPGPAARPFRAEGLPRAGLAHRVQVSVLVGEQRQHDVRAQRETDLVAERAHHLLPLEAGVQQVGGPGDRRLLGGVALSFHAQPGSLQRVAHAVGDGLQEGHLGGVEVLVVGPGHAHHRPAAGVPPERRERQASRAQPQQVLARVHLRPGGVQRRQGGGVREHRGRGVGLAAQPGGAHQLGTRPGRLGGEDERDLGLVGLAQLGGHHLAQLGLGPGRVDQGDDLGPPRRLDEAAEDRLVDAGGAFSQKRRPRAHDCGLLSLLAPSPPPRG